MQKVVLWLGLWVTLLMGIALLMVAFYGIKNAEDRQMKQWIDSRDKYLEQRK